jgi:hypothetical protein
MRMKPSKSKAKNSNKPMIKPTNMNNRISPKAIKSTT